MVKSFLRSLPRWPALERFLTRVAGLFRTWPADDFGQSANASVGTGMTGQVPAFPLTSEPHRLTAPAAMAPTIFEMRFMRLHAAARFGEMWEMLAEDAQRAWGGRETFAREMPRLDDDMELLDIQALSVTVLEGWTDEAHHRTYGTVAQMVMRYRMRQLWREWTFDRQVHLIAAAGGWRALCYPTRVRAAASR